MKSVKLSMTLNVDLTKASDAYTALGMVDGIDIVNVEVITEPQPEAKQAPTTGGATMIQSSFLSEKKRRRRVKRARYDFSSDPKASTKRGPSGHLVLDAERTMRNLGITKEYLLGKKTRQGTLEHSLKMSLSASKF